MTKRKRAGAQPKSSMDEDGFRPDGSKLAVNSYEDVADSEDEFHLHRDKVLLEDGPTTRQRRQIEQDMIEASDDEVLSYSDSEASSDDVLDGSEEEHDEVDGADGHFSDDNASDEPENEEEDLEEWGDSKADYYNADAIQTEEEALAEEQEALRLQKKRRKTLTEADYTFDEDEWAKNGDQITSGGLQDGIYTETLPQLHVTDDMSSADKLLLLKTRYPEFEPLSKELVELQPLHEELSQAALASAAPDSLLHIKFQALSAYLGSLALYFALLTSGVDNAGKSTPLAPNLLREHDIMNALVRCRETWSRARELQLPSPPASDEFDKDTSEEDLYGKKEHEKPQSDASRKSKKSIKTSIQLDAASAASEARREARLKAAEASLASLDADLAMSRKKKPSVIRAAKVPLSDVDSDIGDEPTLTVHEAAEKARKKRSLRFYTSQIAQKANKRANAGRAAGGDDDLPRRERLRDRQDRLMKEAQKRGQQNPDRLGEDSNDESETNQEREARLLATKNDDEDSHYANSLLDKVAAKKADKRARNEAYAQAREQGGQVERYAEPTIGPDGRREIGYQIQKNKGLTPKRSKDVKNPRVKKRRKFEDKTKKLASMKPIYKGGEGRGGYGGELTGIKKGLVRSVKL